MQSGIKAAQELHDAFNALVSSPDQRALLATIENEQLIPLNTIPLRSEHFTGDLHEVQACLSPTKATYILLKTHPDSPDGYTAITFIPNVAPVRQKMLLASTRLTLVRELGIERFRSTIFATEKEELSAEGWARHEKHESLEAPLTEEESNLRGVKEAEASESQGTSTRRGHVSGQVDLKTGDGVVEALSLLKGQGCKGTLVQLKYALPGEILTLDSSTDSVAPQDVSSSISGSEPRYSFYSHPTLTGAVPTILFIYTCPTASKVKERMIYSIGKSWTRIIAERDAGLTIAKSLEATEPDELTADIAGIGGHTEGVEKAVPQEGQTSGGASGGFARPKRPGRRG